MERLDHLPRLIDEDPHYGSHQLQQDDEDYAFLIRTGCTHAQALERIGLLHSTWQKRKARTAQCS